MIDAARRAFPSWARDPNREHALRMFQENIRRARENLEATITEEIGKVPVEAKGEVDAVIAKVDLTICAYHERASERSFERDGSRYVTRYKPHGVIAVLGPFNFPAHLPAGHFLPALLAGNTVIFKPSERAPRVGKILAECWSHLPPGVFNLVEGGPDVGRTLVEHPDINGIFFTGSEAVGRAIHQTAGPEKIVALEMGGNNPLVVWPPYGMKEAIEIIARSAFISAGQRCSCARRLIVPEDFPLEELRADAPAARVIEDATVRQAWKKLIERGGRVIHEYPPGIIDMTGIERDDEEYFGPLLQVIRVKTFNEAIREANATRFGLTAGIITSDRALYEEFRESVRAGVINWNRQLTGASSELPFGGVGASGNHRPSGYFAIDYCVYPVASIEPKND